MHVNRLTPAEAAFIASVTVRDINRVIDEKILPEGFYSLENGRRVRLIACPLVGFYFHTAKTLTAEERLILINRYSERIVADKTDRSLASWRDADWTIHDGFLTVTLLDFVAEADERSTKLSSAQEMVVEDPEVLGGIPVIRGTRIPVYDVVASVSAGLSHERILSAYPGLDNTTIELAMMYAKAAPVRGRPRRFPALPPASAIVSERKVTRRHTA